MISTPEFWVFIAFILLFVFAGKKIVGALTALIEEYRQKISNKLEEVERLHDEAMSLLQSYKQKHQQALEQAAQIVSFAEKEALEFKKHNHKEFEKFMAQKEKALHERLAIEGEEAKAKLRKEAAAEALALVEEFLSKNTAEKQKLTESSLKELSTLARKLGET
jgi:F-type H+-transporting ATPase subunit b